MSMDYTGILKAIATALAADSTLTNMLALREIGGTTSRANSVLYSGVDDKPLTPCVLLRDLGVYPGTSQPLHDCPMYAPMQPIEITVAGTDIQRRAIQGRIDDVLEAAHRERVLDTAQWHIEDIDTSGSWSPPVPLPRTITADGQDDVELIVKTYEVKAATKV